MWCVPTGETTCDSTPVVSYDLGFRRHNLQLIYVGFAVVGHPLGVCFVPFRATSRLPSLEGVGGLGIYQQTMEK